jgi:hypothetical protein
MGGGSGGGKGRSARVGGSVHARPRKNTPVMPKKNLSEAERNFFNEGKARKAADSLAQRTRQVGGSRDGGKVLTKAKKLTLKQQFSKSYKGLGGPPEGVKNFGKALSDDVSAQTLKWMTGGAAGIAGAGSLKMIKNRINKPTLKSKMIKGVKGMFGKGSAGRKALAFGAGAAAIGGGIDALSSTQEAVTTPVKKKMYFKKMMAENPKLSTEKPEDVQKVFNTLFRFNKSIASDPLVAGAFMRRAMQFKEEGIQPVDVKTLVEVAEKRQKSKGDSAMRKIFPTSAAELSGFSKG